MLRKIGLLVLFLGVVMSFHARAEVRAQGLAVEVPVVMLIEGDLWSWIPSSGELVRLSTWGYNFKPVMSPDGTRIAYKSWAQIAKDAFDRNAPMNPIDPPGNIWVISPLTGDGERVADQPRDAVFGSPNGFDLFIARSNPVWLSNTRLAWVELLIPAYRQQLVVYDFNTEQTTILAPEVPLPYEAQGAVDPVAAGEFIAVPTFNFDANTNGFVEALQIYNASTGAAVRTVTVEPANVGDFSLGFAGVIQEQRDFLAVLYSDGIPQTVDPTNGAKGYHFLQAYYSTMGNPASMSLSYTYTDAGVLLWSVTLGSGENFVDMVTTPASFDAVALSPNGLQMTWITTEGGVEVGDVALSQRLDVQNVDALAWAPMRWSVNWPPPYAEQ